MVALMKVFGPMGRRLKVKVFISTQMETLEFDLTIILKKSSKDHH
jgi:hypothetical protein